MVKTLYVGNIPWDTTREDLKEFFSIVGEVTDSKVVLDHETGKAKGYGFVTMKNADEAMNKLNGSEFKGRALKINEAKRNPIQQKKPIFIY